SADGTSLSFVTRSNVFAMTNFTVTSINWASNEWHQIAVTYDATNSALYVDGASLVTNGYGAFWFPDAATRSGGFSVGSSKSGINQARGQFDELATFNYSLAA